MASQVPSGLITQASGANAYPVTTIPIPVVIVGAGAGLSGLHTIGDRSGALNVIALSGSSVSVSGDIVLVVSGGTIQVSGIVGFPSGASTTLSGLTGVSLSGPLGATISGGMTISGGVTVSGGVTISGGVTVSGFVGAISGGTIPVSIQLSGAIVALSGLVVTNSGQTITTLPNALQSGQAVVISGGPAGLSGLSVTVSTSGGAATLVIAFSGQLAPISQGVPLTGDGIGTGNALGLNVHASILAFNGVAWDRPRTVTGSSGGSLGVLAVQPVGYSYALVSGASLVNVKSGAAFLHTIVINGYAFSGSQFEVRDSVSGVAGLVLGTIPGMFSGTSLPATQLIYDTLMTSGIVISTSGALWNLTVTWRTATS